MLCLGSLPDAVARLSSNLEPQSNLQDNHTAAGTCPLCRAPLTPQDLFPRAALLPPGAAAAEAAAKAEQKAKDAALEAELQRFLKVREGLG